MFKSKSFCLFFSFLIVFTVSGCSQKSTTLAGSYELTCEYLKNPDKMIAIADQSAAFWEKAYDEEKGGFYTYVNRDGSVDESQPYKVTSIQARDSYGFARAYQLTGKEEYLDYSRKALDFMYEHSWDKKNGGWYQELNRDGSLPSSPLLPGMDWNGMKWLTLYNTKEISAMVEVTRNPVDLEWLQKGHAVLDQHMWDSRPGFEGYYDQALADWSQAKDKTLGSAEGGLQEFLMTSPYLNMDEAAKNERLGELADIYVEHIVKTLDQSKFGVTEYFDSDWKPKASQPPQTQSGNFMKPAWCLAEAYLASSRDEYKEAASRLMDEILVSPAYDKEHGAPYNTLTFGSGEPIDQKKSWWVVGHSVIAGLITHYATGNSEYLKMADESLNFFMNHLYDHEYGDCYSETDADGSNPVTQKGNYFKGFLHSMELYYYTYLYGNLMILHKPVTLYYYMEPDTKDRTLTLKPVELGEKGKLKITEVTLNDEKFSAFDAEKCSLSVPGNTGGKFKVSFEPVFVK